AAVHTSRTAASATSARSGRGLPAAMYGNSQRSVATPRTASAPEIAARNSWRMPAPAPCASTYIARASGGKSTSPGWPSRSTGTSASAAARRSRGPARGEVRAGGEAPTEEEPRAGIEDPVEREVGAEPEVPAEPEDPAEPE